MSEAVRRRYADEFAAEASRPAGLDLESLLAAALAIWPDGTTVHNLKGLVLRQLAAAHHGQPRTPRALVQLLTFSVQEEEAISVAAVLALATLVRQSPADESARERRPSKRLRSSDHLVSNSSWEQGPAAFASLSPSINSDMLSALLGALGSADLILKDLLPHCFSCPLSEAEDAEIALLDAALLDSLGEAIVCGTDIMLLRTSELVNSGKEQHYTPRGGVVTPKAVECSYGQGYSVALRAVNLRHGPCRPVCRGLRDCRVRL